jgi:hypothetical protein
MLQALIFDVDGTLADTESAHRAAFNAAFAEAGLDWHWSEALYTRLLDVAGGKERIAHYWRTVDPLHAARSGETIARIHAIKTRLYEEQVSGGRLPLRPGIERLITEAAEAGLPMAIATTTTPANVDALLRDPAGPDWRRLFARGLRRRHHPAQEARAGRVPRRAARAGPAGLCLHGLRGLRKRPARRRAAGIPTMVTPNRLHRAALLQRRDAVAAAPGRPRASAGAAHPRRWHAGSTWRR